MGRTEGKNGSFMAISNYNLINKDENPSKIFFFHDPLVDSNRLVSKNNKQTEKNMPFIAVSHKFT